MKVFKKIYTIFAASACAFLLLNGCSAITNGLSSAETADFSVSGEISCSGASPRAATSALKDDITWKISAKKSDGSESVEPVTAKNMTFTLNLPSAGKWKIFASGFSGETQILSGEKEVSVDVKGLTGISISVAVSLDFSKLADFDAVTGNVELPVTDKTGKIAKLSGNLTYVLYDVEPVEEDSGEEVSEEYYEKLEELMKPKSFSATFSNSTASIKLSDLTPGLYDAKIQFLDSAGNALYSCMEQFTVYSGFTTDTWYGTAPYLNDGNFEITSALLGTFASYIVPSTKYALYNFDSTNYTYNFYLKDSANASISGDADFSTSNNSFTFDKDGYIYALFTIDSDIYVTSNRSSFVQSKTSRSIGCESHIAIDRENDVLWLFVEQEHSLYCYKNIGTITEFQSNGNGGTMADEAYVSSNYFYYGDGLNDSYYPEIITAGDGLVYFAGLNSSTSPTKIYLTSSDVTSDVVNNEGNIELHCRNTKALDISSLGVSCNGKITDIAYQNGCVYILLREVRGSEGNGATITNENPLGSRGAVIKYDTVSKETKTIGWTSNSLDNSGKYLYGYSNYSPATPLYKNGQILTISSSDLESAGFSFPNIYSPANSNGGFYGPIKFIAIKPKKLVIADDGLAFYTDENDAYKYKNVNRVVTVDLDTFTLVGNDTSVQFEGDSTGYLAASGFSADWSYFGNLRDASTGYQSDVKFVIPCGD